MKLFLFINNGHVGAFEDDQHIDPFSSNGWLSVYFDYMLSKGVDPREVKVELQINGQIKVLVPFITSEGEWNYYIAKDEADAEAYRNGLPEDIKTRQRAHGHPYLELMEITRQLKAIAATTNSGNKIFIQKLLYDVVDNIDLVKKELLQ